MLTCVRGPNGEIRTYRTPSSGAPSRGAMARVRAALLTKARSAVPKKKRSRR